MNINLEIADNIHGKLQSIADLRGLTIEEVIRWLISDAVCDEYEAKVAVATPVTRLMSVPADIDGDETAKLTKTLYKSLLLQMSPKCPNCTMELTMDAVEKGECQKCGLSI